MFKFIRTFLSFVILLVTITNTTTTYANKKDQEIQKMETEILKLEETEQDLLLYIDILEDEELLLNDELKQIKAEIEGYDKKMAVNRKRQYVIEELLNKKEREIAQIQGDILHISGQKNSLLEYFKQRMRAFNQTDSQYGLLEVILDTKSLGEFIDRIVSIKKIHDVDQQMLAKYQQMQDTLEHTNAELKEKVDIMNGYYETLMRLEKTYEKMLQEKEKYLENVVKLINEKKNERLNKEEQIKQIEQEKKRIENEIKRREALLANALLFGGSGIFITPTTGTLTSNFGPRVHPILGGTRLHKGIDIANSTGTPIWAAANGTVKQAGVISGYGNTIILSHNIEGKRYDTLYAHLDRIEVYAGQQVKQGQQIGRMGSTGYSTGPHLHFEVHVGGYNGGSNAVDPLAFLQ